MAQYVEKANVEIGALQMIRKRIVWPYMTAIHDTIYNYSTKKDSRAHCPSDRIVVTSRREERIEKYTCEDNHPVPAIG